MTPDRRRWIETVTGTWAARAAALRHDAHPSAGMRATVLDGIVARLCAEIPAAVDAPPVAPIATPSNAQMIEADRLEAILANRRGPYRHPTVNVMINDAPFFDDTRHLLRCRIAKLRGLPPPAMIYELSTPPDAIVMATVAAMNPPPEPVPFTAGPQLSFFESAA